MPKLYLNDTFVKQVCCPQNKSQEHFWDSPRTLDGVIRDGAVSGLGLRVTVQGSKAFIHRYEWGGKRRRTKVGDPSLMNVGSARLLVRQRNARLANGEHPDLPAENDNCPGITVSQAIDRYWDTKAHHWSKSHLCQVARLLSVRHQYQPTRTSKRGRNARRGYLDLERFFDGRLLASLKPTEIERYLQQFDAVYVHNRALVSTKALFNWAIRMQLVDMRNPCDPLSKRKAYRKRRDYSPSAIKAITEHIFKPDFPPLPAVLGYGTEKKMAALAQGRAVASQAQMRELCHFMGILFLTMARPKELVEAEFNHFDLKRLVWHKHNTKGMKLSRQAHEYAFRSIPIHQRVADIVAAQRELYPGSHLLFPSRTDPTQPRDNFKRQLAKFKRLEGVPDYFQLYDLKRIAISLMLVGQGVRREDVSHYVDHRGNLETTMIYDLGFVDPMRPVTDRLGELLGV